MAEAKPFVAYDVDGTIFKSSLTEKLIEAGIAAGMFRAEPFNAVTERRVQWQTSNNEAVYQAYLHRLVETLVTQMVGIEVEQFMQVTEAMLATQAVRKFSFPRRLMMTTFASHQQIAISGSPEMLVTPFLDELPIDIAYGSSYEICDGKFNGYATSVGDKGDILRDLVAQGTVSLAGSIAVGDTVSDISMLRYVDTAIMFNPSQTLANIGQKERWPRIHEAKDLITVFAWDENSANYVMQGVDSFLREVMSDGVL